MQTNSKVAFAQSYIESLCHILHNLPLSDFALALDRLEKALVEQRRVFLAGNGGSAATASHMAEDLMKGVAQSMGKSFRAISLSDNVPLITAIANDESYSEIFASQLRALAQAGDVLIVFSGSGNSANIVRAVEVARQMQVKTIAFLGMGGGQVAKMADVSVIVPSNEYGPIEDIHTVFDHLITAYLRSWSSEVQRD